MTTSKLFQPSYMGFMRTLVMVSGLAFLAACSSNEPRPDDEPLQAPTSSTTQSPTFGEQDNADPRLNDRGLLGISKEDRAMFLDPNNPLSTRIVYFDYDSSRIQPQFSQAIQAHANYLSNHPEVRLRLEGHTDERGTREYNVALGERRAESVQKALVLAGAGSNQLSTLSFGEERPAELGSSEAAYAKDRRVELIYVQR